MKPMATPRHERRETIEGLYDELWPVLVRIGRRKFGVPEEDVEQLVQDTALAFLASRTEIVKPQAWLVAAMCNACRHYWRWRRSREAFEEGTVDEVAEPGRETAVREVENEVIARELLGRVPPRDREILRLHYFERLTDREMAIRLRTTRGYAQKLIYLALRRARAVFGNA